MSVSGTSKIASANVKKSWISAPNSSSWLARSIRTMIAARRSSGKSTNSSVRNSGRKRSSTADNGSRPVKNVAGPMNTESIISVVIPCYNAAGTLARTVQSLIAQNTSGTEIIIVDDRSTDDSRAVADSLAAQYPFVRAMQQPVNAGQAAARNVGIHHASGRYLCFLDADDEYAPEFFATALPILESNAELAWVSTGIELVNCPRPVHPVQMQAVVSSSPSNLLIRKAAADLIGGFPESPVFRGRSGGEDIMFRTALTRSFKGTHRAEKFLRYWVSAGNHLNYFLDRSAVVNGELVFTDKSPDEEHGELIAAQRFYRDQVRRRLSVLGSLRDFDTALPTFNDRLFSAVEDFEKLRTGFDAIEGCVHPAEGFVLYHFAKHGPGRGAIVEIGSLFGRSTCWLAAGTCAANREKVVTVDHFRGSPEHQKGGSHPVTAIAQAGTTFPMFVTNLQKRGLRKWVDI